MCLSSLLSFYDTNYAKHCQCIKYGKNPYYGKRYAWNAPRCRNSRRRQQHPETAWRVNGLPTRYLKHSAIERYRSYATAQKNWTLPVACEMHTFDLMPKTFSAKLPQPLKLSHMPVCTGSIQSLHFWDLTYAATSASANNAVMIPHDTQSSSSQGLMMATRLTALRNSL